MSDQKQTYPRPALLVLPHEQTTGLGYPCRWEQVRVRAVTVQRVAGEWAEVSLKEGECEKVKTVRVAHLASTPEKALAMLTPHLEALMGARTLLAIQQNAAEVAAA